MVEHVGLVISGRATAAMDDGRIIEMKAGDLFYIAPGHDSWVVGTSRMCPCTSWAQATTLSRNKK
jgi:mannose-6-phosphate isomerase-like protein (cupin superfamily)